MRNLIISDKFISILIVLNAIILFADSFNKVQVNLPWLDKVDVLITIIFIMEMFLKIKKDSFKIYFKDHWNKLDMAINVLLVPSIVLSFMGEPSLFFLTVLRLVRLAKFFRFLRFVPNIDHLMVGLGRAMRASVFVFISIFLYLFIVSILSCFFFKEVAPQNFGDPFLSLYSTFKIFTVEGWYELPELISEKYGVVASFFVKIYFIFLVITGGMFGMGFVNAVFVDELAADNNDDVLKKLDEISQELKSLKAKIASK